MSNNPLIQIKNLEISFQNESRHNKVIKGIDLTINRGEVVGLVGESGSGKSVTGLAIMGLLPERHTEIKGDIAFFATHPKQELKLLALKEPELRSLRGKTISMIFQEPMSSMNPVYKCGYQVDEVSRLHLGYSKADAREHTLDLFTKVGLPNVERIYNAYPHQISGGQIQRVMIAMALACKPDLIIADEPTTALDVTIQQKILQLLKQVSNEFGVSILFISHDLGVIKQISDRIYIMYKGIICEDGPTQEILTNPQHLYTKSLIACKPPLDRRPDRLPVVSDFVKITETTNGFDFIPVNPAEYTASNSYTETKKSEYKKSDRNLLEIKDLVVRYPTKKNFFGTPVSFLYAVDGVSLNLRKGETVGIVGESGCGKSTLGRAIIGLETPFQGSIELEGKNLSKISNKDWKSVYKRIQIIFQDPYSSLNPRMRIGDAIIEPMLVHNLHGNTAQRKEKMIQLLEQTGLDTDCYNRYPHEFSGGQRQRISIARALALEPEILICDESVSALDVSVQAQILNLLRDLQQSLGLSYLFISHDLSVVNFISHRVFVMNKGKIEESGNAVDIYTNPQSNYTKQLISAIPSWG